MQAVAERVRAGAWLKPMLREMGGRAELKGRRWAAREWARGRKRSWARRKGWVGPSAGKGERVGLGPVLDLISISISFLFLSYTQTKLNSNSNLNSTLALNQIKDMLQHDATTKI